MNLRTFEPLLTRRIGFWRELAICVAIALAARASMIFPLNYSEDTYRFINYPQGADFALFASEMRAFSYPVIKLLEAIGAQYPYAGSLWSILFCVALVFAGLVSMRIWLPQTGSAVMIVGASLFALFPYQSDYLSFHNAAPSFALALVLGWLALYFGTRGLLPAVLSVLALTYVVSGQILFGFLFLVVFFEALIWAFRWCVSGGLRGAFFVSAKPWLTKFALLVVGTVLYLLVGKAIMLVAGVTPGSRLEMSALSDYPAKALLYAKQSYYFLFKGEVSVPLALKGFQLVLLAVVGGAGAYALFAKSGFGFLRLVIWLLLTAVAVAAVGACMGVMLPIKNAYELMNPRTLSALGVYWVGVFALAYSVVSGRARIGVLFVGVLLAFGYAVNANRQAADHARINERDRLVASRMVERLCQQPGFEAIRTVVLVGATHTFNIDRVSTSTGGFNVSSLYRPWSSTAVLREVSGIAFEYPNDADRQKAERAAAGKPQWPLPGSVFVVGDIGVVVMPNK